MTPSTILTRFGSTAAALLLSISALSPAAPVVAKPSEPEPNRPELGTPGQDPPTFSAGEILVGFKKDASEKDKSEIHQGHGASVKKKLPNLDIELVSAPHGKEKEQVAEYRKEPKVAFAEVNGRYYAQAKPVSPVTPAPPGPNDPLVSDQWGYSNSQDNDIDAFEAWTGTIRLAAPAIAILDTGATKPHPDLSSKVARQEDFTGTGIGDVYGHGTHVAGIAGAATNNGTGGAGTCPECPIWDYKVLDNSGSGDWFNISAGITRAADDGAKVVNMSFGAYALSQTVENAVDYAWGKGVVLVAAAGNDGQNWGFYPAAYANVIAVAATTNRDARASFSNWGGNWVDVAAPGAGILSTVKSGSYESWNGTSMASPHVAGVAGIVFSRSADCASNTCVRSRIENRADPIGRTGSNSRDSWAHGRLNACQAVRNVARC
jgi:thermitase